MEDLKNGNKSLRVFVDTDAFIASVKSDDPNHARAEDIFERLKQYSIQFITSNYVFSETITVLSQRLNHTAAVAFINTMVSTDSPFRIYRADEALDEHALQIFREQTSKNTSFVDCANIAFIKDLTASAIFSFDKTYGKNKIALVEDLIEDLEALSSPAYIASIKKAREEIK